MVKISSNYTQQILVYNSLVRKKNYLHFEMLLCIICTSKDFFKSSLVHMSLLRIQKLSFFPFRLEVSPCENLRQKLHQYTNIEESDEQSKHFSSLCPSIFHTAEKFSYKYDKIEQYYGCTLLILTLSFREAMHILFENRIMWILQQVDDNMSQYLTECHMC